MSTTGKRTSREATARRRERVKQLTREGRSAGDIAAIVGITRRSVQRIRTEMGLTQPRTVTPLTDEERRAIEAMLDDGCSYREIARTLGRGTTTIAHHWPGRGWPPGEGGRIFQLTQHAFARIDRNVAC